MKSRCQAILPIGLDLRWLVFLLKLVQRILELDDFEPLAGKSLPCNEIAQFVPREFCATRFFAPKKSPLLGRALLHQLGKTRPSARASRGGRCCCREQPPQSLSEGYTDMRAARPNWPTRLSGVMLADEVLPFQRRAVAANSRYVKFRRSSVSMPSDASSGQSAAPARR
jgi:hypothetical protein